MRLSAVQEERHTGVGKVPGDHDEDDGHPPSSRQSPEPWHPSIPHLQVN
jgi:hypothetical protein